MSRNAQSVSVSSIATETGAPEVDVLALVDQLADIDGSETVIVSDTGGRVAVTVEAADVIREQLAPSVLPDPPCGSTFTPPGFLYPLPCILPPHALTMRCESRSTGGLALPWYWTVGAPKSTPRTAHEAEARDLKDGDVISFRDKPHTVADVRFARHGVEILTKAACLLLVDMRRLFVVRR